MPTDINADLVEYRLKEVEKGLANLQADRDKALKWGILTLGTAVMGMGTWIFNLFAGHIK
jgi:hypothetical protein